MGSVTTSTLTDPLGPAGVSRIDRQEQGGVLWAALLNNTPTGVTFYRSTNGGASWSTAGSFTAPSTILDLSGLHITSGGELWIGYRTNENSEDRIYIRRCVGTATTFTAGNALIVAQPANGGVAASVHTGVDLTVVGDPATGTARVVVAVGTALGNGTAGVSIYAANQAANGTLTSYNAAVTGKRQWLYTTTTGRITPQMDIEHWGGGKGANVPHLWVAFGRGELRCVKLAWNGSTWSGPTTTVQIKAGLAAQDCMPARWDGKRFIMAVPNPDTTDTVLMAERDQANSKTTTRVTPSHPTGVVRNCTISYNSENGDFRIYAVGTSSAVLYFVDFNRTAGTWTSWSTVTATAITGTGGTNYGVRHESYGNARYDVLTAHSGSPNTIASTHQVLTYAPNTPAWVYGSTANSLPANGSPMNVGAALDLVWSFSDPDPADSQSAWALSRQIGAGALSYFRASDSTWQASEQKNSGATTSRTLASAWATHTDANYTYKVKVWDAGDLASLYSDGLVVVPSTPVNPTITAPATDGTTWTSDTVSITWTVTEQTAFRINLLSGSDVLYDSGWQGGTATTFTIPATVADGSGYTVRLWTRNLEGLQSAAVDRTVVVDYVEPPTPTVTPTAMQASGLIRVVVANPPITVYNTNPYFEANTSGWAVAGGTIARSTAHAHEGVASLLLTPSGAAATVEAYTTGFVAATAGQPYTFRPWLRCAVARSVRIAIVWWNGTSETGDSNVSEAVAANTWTQLEATGVAPPGTVGWRLGVSMSGSPPNTHLLYIDEARLMPGGTPDVLSNDVVRRHAGVTDSSTDVTIVRGLPVNATFDDWAARSGRAYEYRALARGANGTTGAGAWTA
ncbi:hypothetical protein [Micromonospora profundi]|uniref:hypothetical protein n=1 Tax=Micromonospora profundi TaxID=1420889 RepID=UPI00366A01EA